MEGRQLLSTVYIPVETYSDNGNNASPIPTSLRAAILQADSIGPGNVADIYFTTYPGNLTEGVGLGIQVESQLPTITVPTIIDGSYHVDAGDQPGPFIALDGVGAPGAIGLVFAASASGSEVHNLTVGNFSGGGIQVNGASHVTLDQDRVGVNVGAYENGWLTSPLANGTFGVELVGSSSDTLNDDVISANTYNGVVIMAGSSGNTVENSMIGTDSTGTTTHYSPYGLGNGGAGGGGSGVVINTGSNHNTLVNDVISGNTTAGVLINGPGTSANTLEYDEIGTDITGQHALPNGNGVAITGGATGNVLETNVISGNSDVGVELSDSGTSYNTIEGNFIGTNWSGEQGVGNAYHGVLILSGASDNLVGGTSPADRNVISANGYDGIQIDYGGTSWNQVLGNFIGTDASGSHALGNGRAGVYIWAGASGNAIGGTGPGDRNVISGNAQYGVMIDSGSNGNTAEGDLIGTTSTGTHPLGNGTAGVVIQAGSSSNDVEFDVISGNGDFGVWISGASTMGNWVYEDEIGTDTSGTINLGNGVDGVYLNGTSGNFVWFCTIADNRGFGVLAIGAGNNSMSLGDGFYGNAYGSEVSD